jgi:hypothetical protein
MEKIRESPHPRPFQPRPVPRKPRWLIPITFAVLDPVRTLHLGPRSARLWLQPPPGKNKIAKSTRLG